jgi:hypothetical protein
MPFPHITGRPDQMGGDDPVPSVTFRILLFRGIEHWVAQGLEYDIAAQGKDIDEALQRFKHVVMAQLISDRRQGRRMFEGLGQAPRSYWESFEKAHRLAETLPVEIPMHEDDQAVPPAWVIAASGQELRVC